MSNTVLSFWDFFWIWWIVVIAGGGTTYLQKNGSDDSGIVALQKQVAELTEEIRSLKRGSGTS